MITTTQIAMSRLACGDLSTQEKRLAFERRFLNYCADKYKPSGLEQRVWFAPTKPHPKYRGRDYDVAFELSAFPDTTVLAAFLRQTCAEAEATCVFIGSEAWQVLSTDDPSLKPGSDLSQNPNRSSILMVQSEIRADDGRVLQHSWGAPVEGDGKGTPGAWVRRDIGATAIRGRLTSILSGGES